MLRPASIRNWCWSGASWTWADASWRWSDPDPLWLQSALPAISAEATGVRAIEAEVVLPVGVLDASASASKSWQSETAGEIALDGQTAPSLLSGTAVAADLQVSADPHWPTAELAGMLSAQLAVSGTGEAGVDMTGAIVSLLAVDAAAIQAGQLKTIHLPPTRGSLTRVQPIR